MFYLGMNDMKDFNIVIFYVTFGFVVNKMFIFQRYHNLYNLFVVPRGGGGQAHI